MTEDSFSNAAGEKSSPGRVMPTNEVTGLPEYRRIVRLADGITRLGKPLLPGKARLPAHCFVDNLYQTAETLTHRRHRPRLSTAPISHWTAVRFCNGRPGGAARSMSQGLRVLVLVKIDGISSITLEFAR
jgi:hypothetical protein